MPTKPERQLRIGIYLRISDDHDGGSTAIDRQRKDCEVYALRGGFTVVDVYEDPDLSAYKRRVQRPDFDRMIDAVKHKHIDGVLAYRMDRIARQPRDLVRLADVCEDAEAFILTTDGVDTRTPYGMFMAEQMVSLARQESKNTSTG